MSQVTLSKAVRSNLLHLQNTATMMDRTQERLATGLKVNSALDNPTNYFTAAALNARAKDLDLLMDSISNGVQTLSMADKAIGAISKLVESAQATARQALQSADTIVSGPTAAAPHAPVTGTGFTQNDIPVGTFTINGQTVTTTEDMAIEDLRDAINTTTAASGVTASIVGGEIRLTASMLGTANPDGNITIAGAVAGTGLSNGANEGTPAAAESTIPNPKRAELVDQYNETLAQITQLARDASYHGVNLLDGDSLEVIFNEEGTSKIEIGAVNFDAAGLGLNDLDAEDFNDNDNIKSVLAGLKGSLDTLRTQASRFGSNLTVIEARQNFTKEMMNVLETGAANLTLADSNEEAANMLALQTRQQLSQTALSLASQADQAVLRLFG